MKMEQYPKEVQELAEDLKKKLKAFSFNTVKVGHFIPYSPIFKYVFEMNGKKYLITASGSLMRRRFDSITIVNHDFLSRYITAGQQDPTDLYCKWYNLETILPGYEDIDGYIDILVNAKKPAIKSAIKMLLPAITYLIGDQKGDHLDMGACEEDIVCSLQDVLDLYRSDCKKLADVMDGKFHQENHLWRYSFKKGFKPIDHFSINYDATSQVYTFTCYVFGRRYVTVHNVGDLLVERDETCEKIMKTIHETTSNEIYGIRAFYDLIMNCNDIDDDEVRTKLISKLNELYGGEEVKKYFTNPREEGHDDGNE